MRKIKKKVRLRGKTDRRLYNLINTAAVIMLIAAALLIVWTALIKIDKLREQYMHFQLFLEDVQLFVISLQSKWLIIIAILLLYLIKAYTGIMPMNALIVISGIVFPMPAAVLINIAGLLVLMSIKYNVGAKGSGSATIYLTNSRHKGDVLRGREKAQGCLWCSDSCRTSLQHGEQALRRAGFPLKSLSFGASGLCAEAFVIQLLGNKVFDPFSRHSFTPIIILFIISGLSMLVLNVIIYGVNDNANAERN